MSEVRSQGGVFTATVLAIAFAAILIGLGIWQLDRKVWKENLIATVTSRIARAPADLPPRASWPQQAQEGNEFSRVTFPAEFLDGQEALVYTAGSPFRPDVKGPGYWVFAPAQLAGGSIVLVNRGFIPLDKKDPATRGEGNMRGTVDIVGVMRWPETRGVFTPADDPKTNVFAVATKDGAPRTMFKPETGQAYWDQQKQREADRANGSDSGGRGSRYSRSNGRGSSDDQG